ncbi:MAG: hypothetical protein H0X02_09505 [Nitrosomonas sp.]|nr:hypothetical protein [Nitrosomonas sp.]
MEVPFDGYLLTLEDYASMEVMIKVYEDETDAHFGFSFHIALSCRFPVQWFWNAIELTNCEFSVAESNDCREVDCEWIHSSIPISLDDELVGSQREMVVCRGEIYKSNIIDSMETVYHEVLDLISESVYAFILCMKRLGLIKDMVQFLGKTLWRSRHDRMWLRLKIVRIDTKEVDQRNAS